MPEEEADFVSFLERTGNVWAIPTSWAQTPQELAPVPLREYLEQQNPDQVFLCPHDFAAKTVIVQQRQDGQDWVLVDSMASYVASYHRGWITPSRELVGNSISAYYYSLNQDHTGLLNKEPAFKKWAEKVFRWVRKWASARHNYVWPTGDEMPFRITPRAEAALSREGLKFQAGPGPSRHPRRD